MAHFPDLSNPEEAKKLAEFMFGSAGYEKYDPNKMYTTGPGINRKQLNRMKKSTITDLPNDIKSAVPNWEENSMLRSIISIASTGEFHDFKSIKSVTPKMDLLMMLIESNEISLAFIIDNVKNGVYDETPDDDDKAAVLKILEKCDPDGRLRKILSLS